MKQPANRSPPFLGERTTKYAGWTNWRVRSLARELGLSREAIWERIRHGRDPYAAPNAAAVDRARKTAKTKAEAVQKAMSAVDARKAEIAARLAAEQQDEDE